VPPVPTLWAVEPCSRPWREYEVNAFGYARQALVGGMHWGDDADFEPIFLAYGPGGVKACAWDFTEAVRYWTGGKYDNHGFMLHGDSHDYLIGHTREGREGPTDGAGGLRGEVSAATVRVA
jgi:hypothetical protein